MKKIVLAIFVVVLLGAAALPMVLGMVAKRGLDQYVAASSQQPGFSLVVDHYESGYLQSHATLRLKLDDIVSEEDWLKIAEMDPEAIAMMEFLFRDGIPFDAALQHGPWLDSDLMAFGAWSMVIDVSDSHEYVRKIKDVLKTKSLAPTRLAMDFLGQGAFVSEVTPVTVSVDGADISFAGASIAGDYTYDNGAISFDGAGEYGEFTVDVIESVFTMSAAPVTVKYTLGQDAWHSPYSVDISWPRIAFEGSLDAEFHNIRFYSAMLQGKKDLIDSEFILSVDSFDSSQIPFGIYDVRYDGALKNVLARFFDELMNLNVQDLQVNAGNFLSEELLRDVLVQGPTIEFRDIHFRLGAIATMSLRGTFSVVKEKLPEVISLSGMGMLSLINALDATLDVKAHESLTEFLPADKRAELEMQLAILLSAGFVLQEDGHYRSKLEYRDGVATVNGKAIDAL